MIPIENISSGSLNALLNYVCMIGVLLVVATVIRLKVPFLRKAFIPASLIAGLIGLALGPHALKVIPEDMMNSMSRLPTQLIVVVFACMFLGKKKTGMSGTMVKDVAASVLWTWAESFKQFAIPCLLCAFVFTPLMGVNELFGAIFEVGFAGGHGTASGMASMFTEQLGWTDGADLAMTTATIGLLSGIFGGITGSRYWSVRWSFWPHWCCGCFWYARIFSLRAGLSWPLRTMGSKPGWRPLAICCCARWTPRWRRRPARCMH